jgi:hypothetical protein
MFVDAEALSSRVTLMLAMELEVQCCLVNGTCRAPQSLMSSWNGHHPPRHFIPASIPLHHGHSI